MDAVRTVQQQQPSAGYGVLAVDVVVVGTGGLIAIQTLSCIMYRREAHSWRSTFGSFGMFRNAKGNQKPFFLLLLGWRTQSPDPEPKPALRSISKTRAKPRSCHFTARFHPPTKHRKRNRRGNFGGPIGGQQRVHGFDGRMGGMLMSAEDALPERRYHSAFKSAIALINPQ